VVALAGWTEIHRENDGGVEGNWVGYPPGVMYAHTVPAFSARWDAMGELVRVISSDWFFELYRYDGGFRAKLTDLSKVDICVAGGVGYTTGGPAPEFSQTGKDAPLAVCRTFIETKYPEGEDG